ncbi:MAG: hypothetical protein H6684_09760 [Deltaproteobacteria bacterium]|nr:hypothetical protein [bacterium]MCB9478835.1 hypothetical protein [Deltaproteobacteria bacterium]MCB9489003.1 hypothetical protein [Deltaproteobacteria bacterium]
MPDDRTSIAPIRELSVGGVQGMRLKRREEGRNDRPPSDEHEQDPPDERDSEQDDVVELSDAGKLTSGAAHSDAPVKPAVAPRSTRSFVVDEIPASPHRVDVKA